MVRPVANRFLTGAAAILLLLAQPLAAAERDAVTAMIAQAEDRQQQARAAEHAWSVTNDFIAEARSLLEAGDVDAASAAAAHALKLAEASLEQAAVEAEAWRARVPGS